MSFNKTTTFALKWIAVFMILGITGTAYGQHDMHQNSIPLDEPGNDIFGTIQEVVQKLEANPDTDWSQVNIEALRQHLLDMKAFTEEVEVLSKSKIDKGVEITILPQSERAVEALKNLFSMHPDMIKKEKGWDMNAKQNGDIWIVTCTTDVETEVEKIRALGYIGLLAEGAHHQLHHWIIATGKMDMK
jgi:gamma-glutamylcysteine synthetase